MTTYTIPRTVRHPYLTENKSTPPNLIPLGVGEHGSVSYLFADNLQGIRLDGSLGAGKAGFIRNILLHTARHSCDWDLIVQTHRSQVEEREMWTLDVSTSLVQQVSKAEELVAARHAGKDQGGEWDWTNVLVVLEDLAPLLNASQATRAYLAEALSIIAERGPEVGVHLLISTHLPVWSILRHVAPRLTTVVTMTGYGSPRGRVKVQSPALFLSPFTVHNSGEAEVQTYWVPPQD